MNSPLSVALMLLLCAATSRMSHPPNGIEEEGATAAAVMIIMTVSWSNEGVCASSPFLCFPYAKAQWIRRESSLHAWAQLPSEGASFIDWASNGMLRTLFRSPVYLSQWEET